MEESSKSISTKEFAAKAGLTYGRVCQLIWAGKIKAIKFGRDWLIDDKELKSWLNKKGDPHA